MEVLNGSETERTISASRLATPTSIAMLATASSSTLYSVSFVPTVQQQQH